MTSNNGDNPNKTPPSSTMRTEFLRSDSMGFIGGTPRVGSYREEAIIGNGAYGTVFKARDISDPTKYVALKKVKIPLNEDGIPVSILREISLVKQLDRFQHPNVVRFLDVCHGPRIMDNTSLVLYLVFEFVEKDLAKYIREARTEDLSPGKIKDIMFQVVCGVDFLHSQRIVHRDLKPQNLLISRTGEVKLADFGLAKVYDFTMRLTSVVVTLWYRSPEVLVGSSYGSPVDMWSVGCIFAELLKRKPLVPGANERDQLEKIFDVIGTPAEGEWPTDAKIVPRNFSPRPPKHLEIMFPDLDAAGVSLLERMLVFNPLERINARDAALHPFFGGREIPPIQLCQTPSPTSSSSTSLGSPTSFSSPSPLNLSTVSPDDSGYASMHS